MGDESPSPSPVRVPFVTAFNEDGQPARSSALGIEPPNPKMLFFGEKDNNDDASAEESGSVLSFMKPTNVQHDGTHGDANRQGSGGSPEESCALTLSSSSGQAPERMDFLRSQQRAQKKGYDISWKDRLWCPCNDQVRYYPGVYTNGECCLMKVQHMETDSEGRPLEYTPDPNNPIYDQYILLLSQHDSNETFRFSAELYVESDDPTDEADFEMIPLVPRAFYHKLSNIKWPLDGGCMNDKSKYINNPMFLLENLDPAGRKTEMMFILLSNGNSLNIRFWEETPQTASIFQELVDLPLASKSSKIKASNLTNNMLESLTGYCSGNSGPYRHNCCTYTLPNMRANTRYLCIASTFHALGDQATSGRDCNYEYDFELLSTVSSHMRVTAIGPKGGTKWQ